MRRILTVGVAIAGLLVGTVTFLVGHSATEASNARRSEAAIVRRDAKQMRALRAENADLRAKLDQVLGELRTHGITTTVVAPRPATTARARQPSSTTAASSSTTTTTGAPPPTTTTTTTTTPTRCIHKPLSGGCL